jgi:NhaP-type Na+/H+ or K+/H+ antiporter
MAEEESGDDLNLVTLLAIIILMIYTVAAPIFEKIHFHYMHESGLCMIIGVIVSLIAIFFDPHTNFTRSINFSGDVFFTFVLPPIIFSAGYNLRKASFFKYFIYILSFGVFGTIMSFLWVAPITLLFNHFNLFYFPMKFNDENDNTNINKNLTRNNITNMTNMIINNIISNISQINENISSTNITPNVNQDISNKNYIHFSVTEILLFASVISATDTIAALTFINEDKEPKLFAILFGEGVVNDAVCIVLYRILREFTLSGNEFTSSTPLMMFSKFLSLAFYSFIIGLLMGCICAYMLKYFLTKQIRLNRTQEISIILFFSFISYTFSEELGLSPIVTLLFTGIFISNYAFYNLSFQAREESSVVSRMISNIAEAFVFTYLGLTLISSIQNNFCLSFLIIEFFVVIFGRIFAIFGLSFLIEKLGVKSFHMKVSQKGIMSCAGSIRGAIAFGLAISIETSNKVHKEILVGTTLILVFFTTIVFGALMPIMINLMKKLDKPEDNKDVIIPENPDKLLTCEHFNFLHPNFSEEIPVHKEKNLEVLKTRVSYWLGHYWIEFDEMIIKPWLCYQWPWNYTDGMNVKKIILTSISKYEKEEKNKTHFIRGQTKETKNSRIEDENNIKEHLLNNNLINSENINENENNNNSFGDDINNKKSEKKKYVELNNMEENNN